MLHHHVSSAASCTWLVSLVSGACIVLDSGTMAVSDIISDHRATYASIKIDLKLISFHFREVWDYKHADY